MEHLPVCNTPLTGPVKEYSLSNTDEYNELCKVLYTGGSLAVVVNDEVLFNYFKEYEDITANKVSFKNSITTQNIHNTLTKNIHKSILVYFNLSNKVNTLNIYRLFNNYILRMHLEYDPATKKYKLQHFISETPIDTSVVAAYKSLISMI